MKVFHTDQFLLPLTPGHTFPAEKYAWLRARVAETGLVAPDDLREPRSATDEEILRVHTADYLTKVVTGQLSALEIRALGLPWSAELVERSRRSCGATIEAGEWALCDGLAVNLAGGTHHAFPDHGAGYCVFNDAAIAIRSLQARGLICRALIVDCDVHQGDGTAVVFEADPSVFTFSLHGANNYPLHKQRSDLDVELADGASDTEYLDALNLGLDAALSRIEADVVFYLAGADPFEGDRLGRLEVSRLGLARRDRIVFERCRNAGLPVAVAMAGGYARNLEETVQIQLTTVAEAARAYRKGLRRTIQNL